MYEVLEREREIEADRRRWNLRLREMRIADRLEARQTRHDSTPPKGPCCGPAHAAS
jgi:hypothetical protein